MLREVRAHVTQKGFRTKELVAVTTLLDADEYPADEIAELYRRRWQAELNLRSLPPTASTSPDSGGDPHQDSVSVWLTPLNGPLQVRLRKEMKTQSDVDQDEVAENCEMD